MSFGGRVAFLCGVRTLGRNWWVTVGTNTVSQSGRATHSLLIVMSTDLGTGRGPRPLVWQRFLGRGAQAGRFGLKSVQNQTPERRPGFQDAVKPTSATSFQTRVAAWLLGAGGQTLGERSSGPAAVRLQSGTPTPVSSGRGLPVTRPHSPAHSRPGYHGPGDKVTGPPTTVQTLRKSPGGPPNSSLVTTSSPPPSPCSMKPPQGIPLVPKGPHRCLHLSRSLTPLVLSDLRKCQGNG